MHPKRPAIARVTSRNGASLRRMETHASPESDGWRLLAQGSGFVVVEKACGLLSVPGLGPGKADFLPLSPSAPAQRLTRWICW